MASMTKIELKKIHQNGTDFYLMVADPRDVLKAMKIPRPGEHQEIQRPWDEKRVSEISKYVAGEKNLAEDYKKEILEKEVMSKGLIPNCPLLSLKVNRITEEGDKVFLNIKDDDDDLFNILDGQHRLFAFTEEFIDVNFKNELDRGSKQYNMGFVVFKTPDKDLMRELFMITNDKQVKPSRDIIYEQMSKMNLLSGKKLRDYAIVSKLNEEDYSPLKGRIKMGGQKIKSGLASVQLVDVFRKTGIVDVFSQHNLDESMIAKKISEYVHVWYDFCPEEKDIKRTLRKISGVRYMMYLAKYVHDYLLKNSKTWNEMNLKEVLHTLNDEVGLLERFMCTNEYDEGTPNPFAGESMTIALAKNDGEALLKTEGGFNLFG